ncbi:HNH endonuclease family protein [Streptomyces sasae]|uniref:HNH endonuclease family protein n=1 Tax=Streptomyces sasae TaxID=1266772 RepID=UPI00293150C7|nr:HNH endonuclease family protein [Streptomyces sasae]
MIKNLLRALPAIALSVLPLAAPAAAATDPVRPLPQSPGSLAEAAAQKLAPPSAADAPLFEALSWIEEGPEGSRDGYSRKEFKHWNKGLNPTDGCDTRKEVILAEALEAPEVGPKCALTGGRWFSKYDQRWIVSAAELDVDHMVPLAEAWDSGAATWTAARREAYANDQGAPNSLIAVSGSSNRSKGEKDPADWLPAPADRCTYAVDWVADKLRWRLSADPAEREALTRLAEQCPAATVTYEQVP